MRFCDISPTHDSIVAKAQRRLHPGHGYCFRCGRPWATSVPHVTNYTESSGCFPLCDGCWVLLGNPEARIEYYAMLIQSWEIKGSPVSENTKVDIQRAVANGG